MNRTEEITEALDSARHIIDESPKHIEILCEECGWVRPVLTTSEMEAATNAHEEATGHSRMSYTPVLGIPAKLYKLEENDD